MDSPREAPKIVQVVKIDRSEIVVLTDDGHLWTYDRTQGEWYPWSLPPIPV
jgi:hypothetical protein